MRRASPAVRIVAIVVVIAMVPSAAAVVIGILTSDEDARVDATDPSSDVSAAPWTVSYSMVETAEPDPGVLLEPLDIGDRAYLSVEDDRSDNWSATGAVVVGDRMAMMAVRSSARGVDTYPGAEDPAVPGAEDPAVQPQVRGRAVALLQALADRLRARRRPAGPSTQLLRRTRPRRAAP